MSNYAISLKRSSALIAALSFMAVLIAVNFSAVFGTASAAQLTNRSLTLSSSLDGNKVGDAVPGSETNGSAATHRFNFTVVGSDATAIRFDYCTTAVGTCTKPTGLDLSGATLGAMTGTVSALDNLAVGNAAPGTGNRITLDDGVLGVGAGSVAIGGIKNPTSVGTFFVRMITGEDNTFADQVDEGTVTSAITEGITITTRVTETLGFSTTADTSTGGIPAEGTACEPLTGSGAIEMGDPTEHTLSITQAYDAYSAFRLYTNASNGAAVQYQGQTLTKGGTDTIDAIGSTATASSVGDEQFGLAIAPTQNGQTGTGWDNLDDTWPTDTAGALELDGEYDGGDGSITDGGVATFAFDDASATAPKTIAQSNVVYGGYVTCASAAVRYIANVAPLTPSGTYTTTIVYSAVPTY